MKQETKQKKKGIPNIQAKDWEPVHNEPAVNTAKDEMPGGDSIADNNESKAILRLKVEQLLQKREAASNDTWYSVGKEVTGILLMLLEDIAVTQQPEIRHKIIATLGQLNAVEAISDLGNILVSKKEDELTQTYSANALGRINDQRVVSYLGLGLANKNAMVRRQIAVALGKVQSPDAIPYLLRLQEDASKDVTLAAIKSLEQLQLAGKTKLKIKAAPKQSKRETKLHPKEER